LIKSVVVIWSFNVSKPETDSSRRRVYYHLPHTL